MFAAVICVRRRSARRVICILSATLSFVFAAAVLVGDLGRLERPSQCAVGPLGLRDLGLGVVVLHELLSLFGEGRSMRRPAVHRDADECPGR